MKPLLPTSPSQPSRLSREHQLWVVYHTAVSTVTRQAVENRLKGGRAEGKQAGKPVESVSIIYGDDGHWGQGGSRGGGDRCLDSRAHFLKVEPTGFADSSSEEWKNEKSQECH